MVRAGRITLPSSPRKRRAVRGKLFGCKTWMRGPSPRMTTVACAIHLADSSEGHKNFPRTVLRASGDPGPPLVACPGSPLARGRRERVFYLAGIGADGSHGKRSRHFRVAPPDARPADHGAPGARR